MKNAKAGKGVKGRGNVAHMVAALRILMSVREENFNESAVAFGKPLVFTAKGVKGKANAVAWIAQSEAFKALGIEYAERSDRPGKPFQPSLFIPALGSRLYGMLALANVLDMDFAVCHRVFADGSLKEVMRRLRIATTKAGGAAALKELDDSLKPPVVKKPAKKKAVKKAAKKAAKKPAKAKKKQAKKK